MNFITRMIPTITLWCPVARYSKLQLGYIIICCCWAQFAADRSQWNIGICMHTHDMTRDGYRLFIFIIFFIFCVLKTFVGCCCRPLSLNWEIDWTWISNTASTEYGHQHSRAESPFLFVVAVVVVVAKKDRGGIRKCGYCTTSNEIRKLASDTGYL